MDGKFDFILPYEVLIKNLGVNYASGVMPTYEEYDAVIVEGGPNGEDEVIDKNLNMNLIFDVGTNYERSRNVVKRSHGIDGREICCLHSNPLFEKSEYYIELKDRTQDKYTANIVVDDMYAQVDDEGHQFQLLADIQNNQNDRKAISKEEKNIRSANGMDRDKIINRVWEVIVLWKDGSTDWIQLKIPRIQTR